MAKKGTPATTRAADTASTPLTSHNCLANETTRAIRHSMRSPCDWAAIVLILIVGSGCVTVHMWEDAGQKEGDYPRPVGVLGGGGDRPPDYVVFEYYVYPNPMLGEQSFLYLIPASPAGAAATAPTSRPADAGKVVTTKDAPQTLQSADFHGLDADAPFKNLVEGSGGGVAHFVVRRDGRSWDVYVPAHLPRPGDDVAAAHGRAAALTPATLALDFVVNPVAVLVYLPLHFVGLVEQWNPPWPFYTK